VGIRANAARLTAVAGPWQDLFAAIEKSDVPAGRSAFAPEGPTSKSGTSVQELPRSDTAYATLVAGVMVPGGSDPNVT
jgi:hypothetical protein